MGGGLTTIVMGHQDSMAAQRRVGMSLMPGELSRELVFEPTVVRVEQRHELACGALEPDPARVGATRVWLPVNVDAVAVALEGRGRAVGGAVVDDPEFAVVGALREHAVDGAVVDRDDDAEPWAYRGLDTDLKAGG